MFLHENDHLSSPTTKKMLLLHLVSPPFFLLKKLTQCTLVRKRGKKKRKVLTVADPSHLFAPSGIVCRPLLHYHPVTSPFSCIIFSRNFAPPCAQVVPDQLVFVDGRIIGRGACSVVNLAKHKVWTRNNEICSSSSSSRATSAPVQSAICPSPIHAQRLGALARDKWVP